MAALGHAGESATEFAIWAQTDRPNWCELLRGYPRRYVPAKQEILRQGGPALRAFALCAGVVKLERSLSDGRSTIVGVRFPGSVLGVGAALLGVPEPLSVVALSPSELMEVPAPDLVHLVRTGGDFSWQLHLEHCRELSRELEQAAGLATLSARERLDAILRLLSHEIASAPANGHGASLELPLRDYELAQLLAITPQWMCQLMRELAVRGQVLKTRNRWHLVRAEAAR